MVGNPVDEGIRVAPGSVPSSEPASVRLYGPGWLPGFARRNLPALLLVTLAISYPEFLTGSTPVLTVLVSPAPILFLLGLYGGGVLLVREISLRWQRGWPTILLLGGAYGIIEEALGTKTYFDPALVGATGAYGHFVGVNWLWAFELTIFHAVFSIALPILTIHLLFPETRGRGFLSSRGLAYVGAAFLLTVALMVLLFNAHYPVGPVLYLGALVAIALFILAARVVPREFPIIGEQDRRSSPKGALATGILFVWLFFGILWLGPGLHAPATLLLGGVLGLSVLILAYAVPRFRGVDRRDLQVSFLIGCLSFLFVLSVFMAVLGDFLVLVVVVILGWMLLRLRRSYPARAAAAPALPTRPASVGSPRAPPLA